MYNCDKCNKEFEKRQSYIAHCRIHSNYIRPLKSSSRKNKLPKTTCQHCGIEFDNAFKLGGHIPHCKQNPNYNNNLEKVTKSNQNKNFKWSDEDKKRISDGMLKYLNEHPDRVPYVINHSSKMSYPEKIFENALISANITGWMYNYRNGIYSYDFAFPEHKIDIEIDGGTHKQERVIKIDERRDKFSIDNGWIVVRFTAKEVKENVINCITKVVEILNKN
jgi:very-short-patch-repair endonuclease